MVTDNAHRWEVYDRYGNKIYITAERWRHALQKQPWLTEYHNEVLTTLRQGRRKQDPVDPIFALGSGDSHLNG